MGHIDAIIFRGKSPALFTKLNRTFSRTMYPFPTKSVDGALVDEAYPGTAVERLNSVLNRVSKLAESDLSQDWKAVRSKLLYAGGLKEDMSTSHAFNDDNHCDLTTMLGAVSHNANEDGAVSAISRRNQLGPHIAQASLPELGEGGSWSTCTNGCHLTPPIDVAHTQFKSRIAFKLVWCPPKFDSFVLVDDVGRLLNKGTPTGTLPLFRCRHSNFNLVRGGQYAAAAEGCSGEG